MESEKRFKESSLKNLIAKINNLSPREIETLKRFVENSKRVGTVRQDQLREPMGCSDGIEGSRPLFSLEEDDPHGGPGDLG